MTFRPSRVEIESSMQLWIGLLLSSSKRVRYLNMYRIDFAPMILIQAQNLRHDLILEAHSHGRLSWRLDARSP